MKKSTESLTRYNYQHLLEVVGRSQYPLTTYQIAKKMGNRSNKYVYEMIQKHLCPSFYDLYATVTFGTDYIPGAKEEEINLATILNEVFELNFPLRNTGTLFIQKGMQFRYVDHSQLEFTRDIVKDTITVSYGSLSRVTIVARDKKYDDDRFVLVNIVRKHQEGDGSISSVEEEPYHFVCKRDGKKLLIHFHKYRIEDFAPPAWYLQIAEDPEVEEKVLARHIEYGRKRKELSKGTIVAISGDSIKPSLRHDKYILNTRGLILLILGKIRLELEKYGGRAQNLRILQVLQNLSHNHVNRFPFLFYFDNFRNEYKLLEDAHKIKQNFIASLIKEIAEELRFQVHIAAEEGYLKYWLIRRFSGSITYYFATNLKMGWINPKDLKYLTFDKLKRYQLINLKAMAKILQSEHEETLGNHDMLLYNNFDLPIYY